MNSITSLNSGVNLAYLVNWFIMAAIVVVAAYVGRDARKRSYSWPETMAWVAISVFIFPVGVGIYFLWIRRREI